MRSSKQRQRNKQNRQSRPSGGNIINRVFDSSGPEGKVRGTPQQIIEKYLQLHRDAQLAGDRVNAENFAQHAEHYTRLLAEAQRDVDRVREEQEQFQRERQQERDRQFEQTRDRQAEQPREPREFREHREIRDQPRENRDQPREHRDREGRDRDFNRDRPRFRPADEAPLAPAEPSFLTQPLFPVLVAEPQDDTVPEPALVETPEERVQGRRERPRRDDFDRRRDRGPRREERPADRAPEAGDVAAPAPVVAEAQVEPTVAAAEPVAEAPAKVRRPRKPRAPRVDAEPTPDAAE